MNIPGTLKQQPCSENNIDTKFSSLWHVIGNTPMFRICYTYRGVRQHIYVKCEQYNLTGSIKDRIALYILQQSYKFNKIRPGDKIVEVSSGNTGISFAAIGKALGHHVQIIMPDWLSRERTDIIRSLGAEVLPVSREQGGFIDAMRLAELLGRENKNIFLPQQFTNTWNVDTHYQTTAPEIWEQMLHHRILVNAFVAGVGTGGTIMGVARYLQKKEPSIKVYPIEPAESPTLTTGYKKGSHRIQGISDEFIPEIIDLEQLEPVIPVHDGDAILMAQLLATRLGLGVGISSGANLVGAIKVKEQLGEEANVVTIFPDCNKKYLSTDLMQTEPVKPEYISSAIELNHYQPLSRRFTTYMSSSD
ncbi:MAG TPA: cysteine synthase family protein [Mucilaginibacter sp.]|nr:cysteine synthase family protein [Mucilaginibacter sp.]